jgi:hypothetical protein
MIKIIIKKILLLYLFWKFVDKFPKLQKYSKETRFSIYRSLICLFFTLYSLQNSINFFTEGFSNPFDFKSDEFTDICSWFLAYIMFDFIKIIFIKNKRIDLIIHHSFFLIVSFFYIYYDKIGYFSNFILLAESISIFSGTDKMEMEKNNMKKSKDYKVYRKKIIKYLRIPIWITTLLLTLKNTKKQPSVLWYINIFMSLFMIKMDKYWENKCDKIIKKYKNNS